MQEELGADVREVGALGERWGVAVHELANPGAPLGMPPFLPTDRTCTCLPRTPKISVHHWRHICEQTETQHNLIDGFPLVSVPEQRWQEHTEMTISENRDLGLSEVKGLTQLTRP